MDSEDSENSGKIGRYLIILSLFLVISGRETYQITVTDKDVNHSSDNYLIFSEYTTFEIKDSLFYWGRGSSDLYGKIEKRKTYKIDTYGW